MRPARNNNNHRHVSYEKYLHAEHFLRGGAQSFVPVVVRKPESGLRPRAEMSSAIELLFEKIENEIIHPLLTATSGDELQAMLDDKLSEFMELSRTLTHLRTVDSSVDNVLAIADQTAEHSIAWLCSEAKRFSGPSAAEEARFAAETYAAAVHATRRVRALTRNAPEERVRETRTLAIMFRIGAALHELGALLIVALANGRRGTDASVSFAFEMLRGGALQAYSSVRDAETILAGEKEIGPPLPFDDEDDLLADAD